MSNEVVVVLPWVPATATERARAQIDASIPARRSIERACVARCDELDVGGRDRSRPGHSVDALDERRVVADVHLHAERAQPVEHRQLVDVAARHGMAHLGEHGGDRAHARATHADHVQPQRWSRQVERSDGRASGPAPADPSPATGGRLMGVSVTTAVTPRRHAGNLLDQGRQGVAAVGLAERSGSPRHRRQRDGVTTQALDLGIDPLCAQLRLRDQHRCSGVGQPAGVVGLVVACRRRPGNQDRGHADRGELGTVLAPAARQDEVGRRVHQGHLVLEADHVVQDAVSAAERAMPGRELAQEALADHVAHCQIRPRRRGLRRTRRPPS